MSHVPPTRKSNSPDRASQSPAWQKRKKGATSTSTNINCRSLLAGAGKMRQQLHYVVFCPQDGFTRTVSRRLRQLPVRRILFSRCFSLAPSPFFAFFFQTSFETLGLIGANKTGHMHDADSAIAASRSNIRAKRERPGSTCFASLEGCSSSPELE